MRKVLTLCIIHKEDRVLLGMKKKGFGEGRWNGFGGKVEEAESIEEAMQREVQEEVGLVLKDFEKRGVLEFEFQGDPTILEVHIYKAEEFEGEPVESEEMRPKWFSVDDIPFNTMWPDDKYWFPLFLEGKNFKGKFLFQDFDTIIDYNLDVLDLGG
ncbi:8-oxo-dGTP diphosphatase [Patescibacteria group bacterium]|nr:8-oxo-dGTP diphosphatase [Patescibacteria group bacterium]